MLNVSKTLGPSSFSVWAKKLRLGPPHRPHGRIRCAKELNFKSKFKTPKFSFPSSVLNAQPSLSFYPKTSLQFSLSLLLFILFLSLSLPWNQSIDPSRVSVLYICLKLIHFSPSLYFWGGNLFRNLLNKWRSLDCCCWGTCEQLLSNLS